MLLLVAGILYVLVVVFASIAPKRSKYSAYERSRRQKSDESSIQIEILRESTADIMTGLLRVLTALSLVLFILAMLAATDWLMGSLAAVAGVVLYGFIARMTFVYNLCQRLYGKVELSVLGFVHRHQQIFRFFRSVPVGQLPHAPQVASREELLHTIDQLPGVLTKDERTMLQHNLTFSEKTVEEVMTPRSVLDTVKRDEVLGPLLLDELHATGHSRFPVIDEDIDHVVGILYIHDLLQLHDKKTHTAEKVMSAPVHYIKQEQSLTAALAAFLRTHRHLFVVVNEYRETVGVVTLEDVVEELLGREIVDEFDQHDDLRAVAARNPRGNNHPPNATNV